MTLVMLLLSHVSSNLGYVTVQASDDVLGAERLSS